MQNTQPVAEPVKEPEKAPDTELDRLAKILARANPEASEETIRREAAAMVTNIPALVEQKPQETKQDAKERPEIAGNEDKNFES